MPKEFRDGDRDVQIMPPKKNRRRSGPQEPPENPVVNVIVNQRQPVGPAFIGFMVVALIFTGMILFFTQVVLPATVNVLLLLSIFFHGRKVLLLSNPPGLPPFPQQPKVVFYILLVVVFASYAKDPHYQGFPFNWVGMVTITILALKVVFILKAPKPVLRRIVDYSAAVAGVVYPALIYLAWFGTINMSR